MSDCQRDRMSVCFSLAISVYLSLDLPLCVYLVCSSSEQPSYPHCLFRPLVGGDWFYRIICWTIALINGARCVGCWLKSAQKCKQRAALAWVRGVGACVMEWSPLTNFTLERIKWRALLYPCTASMLCLYKNIARNRETNAHVKCKVL